MKLRATITLHEHPIGRVTNQYGEWCAFLWDDVDEQVYSDSVRSWMAIRAFINRLRMENPKTLEELQHFVGKESSSVQLESLMSYGDDNKQNQNK